MAPLTTPRDEDEDHARLGNNDEDEAAAPSSSRSRRGSRDIEAAEMDLIMDDILRPSPRTSSKQSTQRSSQSRDDGAAAAAAALDSPGGSSLPPASNTSRSSSGSRQRSSLLRHGSSSGGETMPYSYLEEEEEGDEPVVVGKERGGRRRSSGSSSARRGSGRQGSATGILERYARMICECRRACGIGVDNTQIEPLQIRVLGITTILRSIGYHSISYGSLWLRRFTEIVTIGYVWTCPVVSAAPTLVRDWLLSENSHLLREVEG